MGATSSTLLVADLALTWDNTRGCADLTLIDSDLASDPGMETAVLLSLFVDRRAFDDDVPPSGDVNDRRGWWADAFADTEGDLIGSRLWLLDRSISSDETRRRAIEYCNEALQWMVDDRVVSKFEVTVELDPIRIKSGATMLITVTLDRVGRDPVTFKFAHVWDQV